MDDPRPPNYEPPQLKRPWWEKPQAPLRSDEIDDYDRQMAPERFQKRRKLFL